MRIAWFKSTSMITLGITVHRSLLITTIASLLIGLFSLNSYAQAKSSSANYHIDETMVITANRYEQSTEEIIIPIEIMTKEDIESMQAKSLDEILRRLPGVQIGKSGGYGQPTSLFVRGTESDHVLILVNGVRYGSATSGTAAINMLSLNSVEKIEYIRGPRTALYGADAIGGVINIITTTTDEYTKITGGMGSDAYQQFSIVTSFKPNEQSHIKLAMNREQSDGFSSYSDSNIDYNPERDKDNDGFDNTNFSINATYQFTDAFKSQINMDYNENHVDYDPYYSVKDNTNYQLTWNNQYVTNKWDSHFVISTNQDKDHDKNYSSWTSSYSNTTYQTQRNTLYLNTFNQVSDNLTLGFGLDWYKDDVSGSSANYDETSRTNTAGFISGRYQNTQIQIEASLRNDENQRYGNNTTWQFGLGYQPLTHYRLSLNAGTAFRAPTFNDLYANDPIYGSSSNPDLKPEESKNIEIAMTADYQLATVRIAAYQNNISDLIVYVYNPSGMSSNENVDDATIKGIELSTQFYTGSIMHQVSFDWMDPKNNTTGETLARRAKRSGKWNSSYTIHDFLFDFSYLYQGERLDYSGGDMLKAYSLIELSTTYFINSSWTISGRIANVLDEEYETAGGYNTQERSYFLTLSYQH